MKNKKARIFPIAPSFEKSTTSETNTSPGPCALGSPPNSKMKVKTISPIITPIRTLMQTIFMLEVRILVRAGRLAA